MPEEVPKCKFYLKKKKKLCKFDALPGSFFCHYHQASTSVCPRCESVVKEVESHLKKCPVYLREISEANVPFYQKGINGGPDSDSNDIDISLAQCTKAELFSLISRVEAALAASEDVLNWGRRDLPHLPFLKPLPSIYSLSGKAGYESTNDPAKEDDKKVICPVSDINHGTISTAAERVLAPADPEEDAWAAEKSSWKEDSLRGEACHEAVRVYNAVNACLSPSSTDPSLATSLTAGEVPEATSRANTDLLQRCALSGLLGRSGILSSGRRVFVEMGAGKGGLSETLSLTLRANLYNNDMSISDNSISNNPNEPLRKRLKAEAFSSSSSSRIQVETKTAHNDTTARTNMINHNNNTNYYGPDSPVDPNYPSTSFVLVDLASGGRRKADRFISALPLPLRTINNTNNSKTTPQGSGLEMYAEGSGSGHENYNQAEHVKEAGGAFPVWRHRIDIRDLVLARIPALFVPPLVSSTTDTIQTVRTASGISELNGAANLKGTLKHPNDSGTDGCCPPEAVVVSKHLCGRATDYTLHCVFNGIGISPGTMSNSPFGLDFPGNATNPTSPTDTKLRLGGFCVATCCHHKCVYEAYAHPNFLQQHQLTAKDFNLITRMSSWAVCGSRHPTTSLPAGTSATLSKAGEKKSNKQEKEEEPREEAAFMQGSEDGDAHSHMQAAPMPAVASLSLRQRTLVGRQCKRLLDVGRCLALSHALNHQLFAALQGTETTQTENGNAKETENKHNGVNQAVSDQRWCVCLVPYVPPSLSLENTVLLAVRVRH
jgi:hypothetical protein